MSAGLEDELIKKFKPKYNLHGKSKIIEDIETNDENIIIKYNNQDDNCYTGVKVASNANLKGIINLSFIPKEYLPEIGTSVFIYLDDIIFEANFTNGNKIGQYDPRVNSKLIGNWLTERINLNDNFYVKVCNKNKFYFLINA